MDRHTLAVSQSQGNATADYPPSPCLQTPSFLPSHRHALFSLSGSLVLSAHLFQAYPPLSIFSKSNTCPVWTNLCLKSAVCLLLYTVSLCALAFSSAAHQQQLEITDLGLPRVSSGVKWFHGYKYYTAHKQVLGYKGLACICTTPSFSCAAWITYCTADTSISRS